MNMTNFESISDIWQQAAIRLKTITNSEVANQLKQYGMLPQLAREMIVEEAIANVTLSKEDITKGYRKFYQEQQLNSDTDLDRWLVSRGMSRERLDYLVTRTLKLEQFKKDFWGDKLDSYFVQRKITLDRVVYSLIRVKDIGIAQEIYFRIQEGEQSFSELASLYSEGMEAQTGGILGPVELNVPHPILANILAKSQPGQLSPPTRLEEWFIIVRLEKLIPAQLDEAMQQRLLEELFENWINSQLKEFLSAKNIGSIMSQKEAIQEQEAQQEEAKEEQVLHEDDISNSYPNINGTTELTSLDFQEETNYQENSQENKSVSASVANFNQGGYQTSGDDVEKKVYKIVCIDDSPTVLRIIRKFLDEEFFSVTTINNPLKALIEIIRSKPDLILLDISMPTIDGYELCSRIRKHTYFKNTPVIMVTGRNGFIDRARAKMVRSSGYLTKPFTQDELLNIISKHLT